MSLGERLKQARLTKKLTQQQLAEKVGIKQQAIQRIEAGKVRATSYVVQLAELLEVSPHWLAIGEDSLTKEADANQHNIHLLDWASALQKLNGNDTNLTILAHLPSLPGISKNAFALLNRDDAMLAPHGNHPSFHIRDILIFEPTQQAKNNDYVLASHTGQQLQFRQYTNSNANTYLNALNPQYKRLAMTSDSRIYAVLQARYSLFNINWLEQLPL